MPFTRIGGNFRCASLQTGLVGGFEPVVDATPGFAVWLGFAVELAFTVTDGFEVAFTVTEGLTVVVPATGPTTAKLTVAPRSITVMSVIARRRLAA